MLRFWVVVLALVAAGCITTTRLIGGPADGEADAGPDGDVEASDEARSDADADRVDDSPDAEPDDGTDAEDSEPDDGAFDDAPEDDAAPPCPVWAVPSGSDPREDGTEAHPFITLQRALDTRGDCDHVILRDGTTAEPFNPRFDVSPLAGETLTIEGDPVGPIAELDAADAQGLVAVGEGALVLRHLAIRNGRANKGGCLDADVGELLVEDTEWSGCTAEWDVATGDGGDGGAIRAVADHITIRDSGFHDNTATNGAGLWLDGPRETVIASVENCRFEDNTAVWGAIYSEIVSVHTNVANNRFLGNAGEQPGAAVFWRVIGTFQGNRIENHATGTGAAVVLGGSPGTSIRHNIFIGNRTNWGHEALEFGPAYGEVSNNLFLRNSCEWGAGGAWCGGAVLLYAGHPDFRNNTFVGNSSRDGPADLAIGSVFGLVRDNVFYGGVGTVAVARERDDEETMVAPAYNDAWSGPAVVFDARLPLGEGNLFVDPLFVAPAADDFRLGAGSPCIDAGDPDPAMNDDDGSRNDIGAFGGPDGAWTPLGP